MFYLLFKWFKFWSSHTNKVNFSAVNENKLHAVKSFAIMLVVVVFNSPYVLLKNILSSCFP